MSQPLTITFTIAQPDNILERGALLTDAKAATEAFLETMKAHKPTHTTAETEKVKTRKPRTVHPVADAPVVKVIKDAAD